MKYTKPALSFPDQADLLIGRGLNGDRDKLIRRLEQVNYYRLSAYWYSFRQPGGDDLHPGTTLDSVWDRYVFDRQLRVCVMDAIERVEVAIKTQLAASLALQHGPFAHLDRTNLPNMKPYEHRRLLDKIQKGEDRSREEFVKHFHGKYTSETNLPIWMAIEVMDFGTMLTLFKGSDQYTKRPIAACYELTAKVLESWLLSLNYLRNLCAHHARLWNRVLSVAPLIPNTANRPEFHTPVAIPPNRAFTTLTILQYLLGFIAPQSGWAQRLETLWTEKHPNIPIDFMGFPPDWKTCPIWNES